MKLSKSRKSEAITVILVTLMVLVFFGWLINLHSRECRSNNDCNDGFYCGSDFSCHQMQVIEKNSGYNLLMPSIIIGIAIIIAAMILKGFSFKRENAERRHED